MRWMRLSAPPIYVYMHLHIYTHIHDKHKNNFCTHEKNTHHKKIAHLRVSRKMKYRKVKEIEQEEDNASEVVTEIRMHRRESLSEKEMKYTRSHTVRCLAACLLIFVVMIVSLNFVVVKMTHGTHMS